MKLFRVQIVERVDKLMGDKDSSKTRVRPMMRQLQKFDYETFMKILNLMKAGFIKREFNQIGIVNRIAYNDEPINIKEFALTPSEKRLLYLLENAKKMFSNQDIDKIKSLSVNTKKMRKQLISDDKEISDNALNFARKEIEGHSSNLNWPKAWWVLEGDSYPDIFIETDKYIFVGEAKRTEAKITSSISYDKDRIQIVRHIEGAINYNQVKYNDEARKEVISFYIVSTEFEKNNLDSLVKTGKGDVDMWDNSLTHLNKNEISEIKNTYIGYQTWEEIEKQFGFVYI